MARRSTRKKALALYIIRNARTRQPVLEEGGMITFSTKQKAKAERSRLNNETGEVFVVSPGPQHKNWRG